MAFKNRSIGSISAPGMIAMVDPGYAGRRRAGHFPLFPIYEHREGGARRAVKTRHIAYQSESQSITTKLYTFIRTIEAHSPRGWSITTVFFTRAPGYLMDGPHFARLI